MARLSGRLQCRQCKKIYNKRYDDLAAGDTCPECGGEIYQRDDDQEEAIRQRLAVYREQTAPLINYYASRGRLAEVPAEGDSIENIAADVVAAVRERIG